MRELFSGSELIDLIDRVEAGERLNFADAMRLFCSRDLLAIGYMADKIRRRKHGKKVYYITEQTGQHRAGIAALVYGQGESGKHKVELLLRLREEQDRTGGFAVCKPTNFSTQASETGGGNTGFADIKLLAVARILLDNFTHIQVSTKIGVKLAQVSLAFGVDSLETGDTAGQVLDRTQLVRLIRAAGYEPAEHFGDN